MSYLLLASYTNILLTLALDKSQCFYTYKNRENIESFFKFFH